MSIDSEWDESMATTLVEFTLKLDPVQSKRVQEAFHDIHAHHDAESDRSKNAEADPEQGYTGHLVRSRHV